MEVAQQYIRSQYSTLANGNLAYWSKLVHKIGAID